MKETLDRSAFRRSIPILAARVLPAQTGLMLKAEAMKRSIMNLPKVRSVVSDPADSNDRLVLLRVQHEADLSPEARTYLEHQNAVLTTYTLELDYDYWTADEILQAILPENLLEGSPTGFAITGHLAHLNLNDEYLPYKYIIGQVVLDKNKRIRTVVNKLNSIDTQFRFFKMELIAGEPNFIVEHHESDCRFTFDFSKVYWNSRLHTEHERLVQQFDPTDVVADVFAGVGPFAVPAAKKGCAVLANDLNPESYKWLVGDLVRASCEDGREFIRKVALGALDNPFPPYTGPKATRSQLKEKRRQQQGPPIASSTFEVTAAATSTTPSNTLQPPSRSRISHFVMNLPDSAITFLDAFRGIFNGEREKQLYLDAPMPMVHCHCFTRELEPELAKKDITERVQDRMGLGRALGGVEEDAVSLHLVRSVAPNKDMYCISFRLPREVAFEAVEA
ncbi:hypothetical protein EVG20_g571 [Dentipellis fragilis]|uniref:tRNA (guanine(37)-N1)-methyltransferase n=1 Tax=Dentipellis fragilis TaxID=205917 RepID=A0A4Y9ZCU3_9AGAM|nr:hypothetical protein EVG20_g571 [Dentipellis fragilis]